MRDCRRDPCPAGGSLSPCAASHGSLMIADRPSYLGRPVNEREFNGLLALIQQVRAAHRLLFTSALQLLNSLT